MYKYIIINIIVIIINNIIYFTLPLYIGIHILTIFIIIILEDSINSQKNYNLLKMSYNNLIIKRKIIYNDLLIIKNKIKLLENIKLKKRNKIINITDIKNKKDFLNIPPYFKSYNLSY